MKREKKKKKWKDISDCERKGNEHSPAKYSPATELLKLEFKFTNGHNSHFTLTCLTDPGFLTFPSMSDLMPSVCVRYLRERLTCMTILFNWNQRYN